MTNANQLLSRVAGVKFPTKMTSENFSCNYLFIPIAELVQDSILSGERSLTNVFPLGSVEAP